jgi:hypothetical protein
MGVPSVVVPWPPLPQPKVVHAGALAKFVFIRYLTRVRKYGRTVGRVAFSRPPSCYLPQLQYDYTHRGN